MKLHSGHLLHNPSGVSFLSFVLVNIPFLILLNQLVLVDSFPSSPARFESKSSTAFAMQKVLSGYKYRDVRVYQLLGVFLVTGISSLIAVPCEFTLSCYAELPKHYRRALLCCSNSIQLKMEHG